MLCYRYLLKTILQRYYRNLRKTDLLLLVIINVKTQFIIKL